MLSTMKSRCTEFCFMSCRCPAVPFRPMSFFSFDEQSESITTLCLQQGLLSDKNWKKQKNARKCKTLQLWNTSNQYEDLSEQKMWLILLLDLSSPFGLVESRLWWGWIKVILCKGFSCLADIESALWSFATLSQLRLKAVSPQLISWLAFCRQLW